MECAVKVAKGSEEMHQLVRGQQRSREDTEDVSGRKEQFQEAEFPSDTRSLALPNIQKDRPRSTCNFPLMVNEVPSQAIHARVSFKKVALQAEHDSPPGILGRLKREFIRPA